MRPTQLHVLLVTCFLTLAGVAQVPNLNNGDFEDWTSGMPNDWGWVYPASQGGVTFQNETTAGNVYCGSNALRMSITQPWLYQEFGKAWYSAGGQYPIGTTVRSTIRVKLSHVDLAPAIKIVAYDYVSAGCGQTTMNWLQPAATTDWQELTVSYTTTRIGSANCLLALRTGMICHNAPVGRSILLDYAVFGGSSPVLNGGTFPDHEVQSDALSLLIDGATGNLRHLRRIGGGTGGALGQNLLHPAEPSHLFAIAYDVGAGQQWMNTGLSFPPTSIDLLSNGVRVVRDGATDPLRVEVRVTKPSSTDAEPTLSTQLHVDLDVMYKQSNVRLTERSAPTLSLVSGIGGSHHEDEFFIAAGDGCVTYPMLHVVPDPPPPQLVVSTSRLYPGTASMQLVACYDDEDGIALAGRDPAGEAKKLAFSFDVGTTPGASSLSMQHLTPDEARPVQTTESSFTRALVPCRGSWMMAAKAYRNWALNQTWATTRPAICIPPAWVNARPTLLEANLTPLLMGMPLVRLVPSTTWASVMNDWSTALGGSPIAGLFRAFEQHGIYASGPSQQPLAVVGFRNGSQQQVSTEAEIDAAWNGVVSAGHNTMAMVAGLKWYRSRPSFPTDPLACPGPAPYFDRAYWVPKFLDAWSQHQTFTPTFDQACVWTKNPNAVYIWPFIAAINWNGAHGRLCAGYLPGRQKLMRDFAAHLASKRMQMVELDQMSGGGTEPCYNPHHTHPPGHGRWQADAVAAMMLECQTAGRCVRTDFALSLEDPGEFFIPYLGAYLTRVAAAYGWPALVDNHGASAHIVLVPAFQFVYSTKIQSHVADHGLSDGFGLQSAGERQRDSMQLARGFVSGAWLYAAVPPWAIRFGAMTQSGDSYDCDEAALPGPLEPRPATADANQVAFMNKAVRFTRGPAAVFFTQGLMAQTQGEVVNTMTFTHPEVGAVTVPDVAFSAWVHPNGLRALVVANARYNQASPIPRLPDSVDGVTIAPSQVVLMQTDPSATPIAVTWSSVQTTTTIAPNGIVFFTW